MEKKLFGLENTIVDYTSYVSDDIIKKYSLQKGGFNSITEKEFNQITKDIGIGKRSAGGAVANVLHGFCKLGGKALFCGAVGTDNNAKFYKKELEKANIETALAEKQGLNGKAHVLITPDKERTFALSKGKSMSLYIDDIPFEKITKCWMLYTTAYALDHPEETVEAAMKKASQSGINISFNLASVGSVENYKERINRILKNYCNIVFANEEEAQEITGRKEGEAALRLQEICGTAIVTLGKKGALAAYNDEVYPVPITRVQEVNSNGAGDGFAAGFLYAFSQNKKIEDAADFGSFYASKIVEIEGTRLDKNPRLEDML